MKPQLADNYDLKNLEAFLKSGQTIFQQPKIDGVRGLHITGQFTGRSLKVFKNRALTEYWSADHFAWLDGEMVISGGWTQPGLCRLTTGLCNTVKAAQVPELVVFDYLAPEVASLPYWQRYNAAEERVAQLRNMLGDRAIVHLIPCHEVTDIAEVFKYHEQWMDEGYEGSILRNPLAQLKEGRPGSKTMELMRIKDFIDFEFIATELVEAMENMNEAKINELGHTERSTHQENMRPKGMVGAIKGRFLQDVVHNGKRLFEKDQPLLCGPGQMTHAERAHYWRNQHELVGQISKAKLFPHGTLNKPRMPIWLSLRAAEDM